MSHAVFQTAQIMPIKTLSSSSSSSKGVAGGPYLPPVAGKKLVRSRRGVLVLKAFSSSSSSSSSSAVVEGDSSSSVSLLERCLVAPPAVSSSSSSMLSPVMKGQYGAFGAVTLEKGKLDTSQKQSQSSPELFDRKFVDAVLNEWQKTMMDLPAGFRQAYEMVWYFSNYMLLAKNYLSIYQLKFCHQGLVSSAQMVKFLAINARPTTTRFISRALPEGMSRAFIGRMIADPAFLYKLLLEQAATIGCSVWWELKNRKDRIKQEWDLALINVLTIAACNAVVVWSLAPCRSYGNTFQNDLQNTLQKLPNNIFEKSYPLREFDLQKRIHSFFYKAAELCMVGLSAGAVQGTVSNFLASKKGGRLSVTIPTVSTNALGYGAFLGLYANLRYQLLSGFDRAMISHFDVIGVALFFSTALRILNVQLGERSRLAWLGVEADPLVQSDSLLKVYSRPSEDVNRASSKWFISKNAIVSGLGLLGIKQGTVDSVADGEPAAPKARRKRIVRKKVTTS
ncbi:protein reticulata-related 1 [Quercus suber]|uniref:Protein reticulata-related 1 n=1 Tax=Quercus suber TaxID=58331 RepID=A0AAW0K6I7_QUESU